MPDLGFLTALFTFLEQSKYVLIALGSYFEGSAVMMATGLLWHIEAVSFWPACAALLVGDILADITWYTVGRFAARSFFMRWGHFIGVTPGNIDRIEKRFHRYHTKILIVSKLTMGFGLAVPILTVAGMLRVPFTRYLVINIIGGLLWVPLLMGIGYYFGNVLQYIPKDFQIALLIAIPVIFFFVLRSVNKKLSKIEW